MTCLVEDMQVDVSPKGIQMAGLGKGRIECTARIVRCTAKGKRYMTKGKRYTGGW